MSVSSAHLAALPVSTQVLDAVDSMAFSAMRICALKAESDENGKGSRGLVEALVNDGSSIGGLESEIRLPSGAKVSQTISTETRA